MDNDEKLNEFVTITGTEAERARFFLESSGWQLDLALTSFYEHGDEDAGTEEAFNEPVVESGIESPDETPETAPAPAPAKPKPRANSRFATVQSLQQQNSSDEEEGQAFYAGGSRNSGQQILGPPKKKDIVSDMFKSVQEHGAEVVDPDQPLDQRPSFSGTGYRLGNTPDDTTTIAPPPKPKVPQTVILKLWSDGFNLGNGPLRPYANPENRAFLECIKRGEVPQELTRDANGSEVHLDLEDHRHDVYTPSKTGTRAFTGKGHTLGSPAPSVVQSEPAPSPIQTNINNDKGNEQAAVSALKVDDTAPCTNVQVRLSDGSRLSGRFNHSHTIADLRRYIIIARPQYEDASFALMTSYPSRELTNLDETLASAGLLNAAVMLRMNSPTPEEASRKRLKVRFSVDSEAEVVWPGKGYILGSLPRSESAPEIPSTSNTQRARIQQTLETIVEEIPTIAELNANVPRHLVNIHFQDGFIVRQLFRYEDTIGDVMRHIRLTHPEYLYSDFILVTHQPRREYLDHQETLIEANLINGHLYVSYRDNLG